MPKPYTVEYEQRSPGAPQAWSQWYRGITCPPLKGKFDVGQLPAFKYIEMKHKNGVIGTVQEVLDYGGGQWTKRRAEVAINELDASYPPSHP